MDPRQLRQCGRGLTSPASLAQVRCACVLPNASSLCNTLTCYPPSVCPSSSDSMISGSGTIGSVSLPSADLCGQRVRQKRGCSSVQIFSLKSTCRSARGMSAQWKRVGCSARSAVTRKARGLTVCVVHERFFKLTRDDVDHGDDEDPGERDEGCQEVVVNHLAALQRNSRAVIRNFKPETQAKEGA